MSSSSQRGDAKFMNYINLFENEDIVIRSPSIAGNQFGVFSKRNLFASNTQKLFLATNPGFFMNNCDLGDFFRRYVFQHNPCDTFLTTEMLKVSRFILSRVLLKALSSEIMGLDTSSTHRTPFQVIRVTGCRTVLSKVKKSSWEIKFHLRNFVCTSSRTWRLVLSCCGTITGFLPE